MMSCNRDATVSGQMYQATQDPKGFDHFLPEDSIDHFLPEDRSGGSTLTEWQGQRPDGVQLPSPTHQGLEHQGLDS